MNKLRLAALCLLFSLILAHYISGNYLQERRELNNAIFSLANYSTDMKYYIAYKSVSLPYKRNFISENNTIL